MLTLSVAAVAIGGCASSMVETMPSWADGEPANIPARPATPLEYPAVNERPPARSTKLISEDEEAQIERQLTAARDNQAPQTRSARKSPAVASAGVAPSSAAKAKAAAAKAAQPKAKVSDSPIY